mmetsp:Transcript_9790/g.21873  ORF Transcript_9790/g.21873 Transcript_9790/m.21873 type:complete len:237 (-) Transcript_9790:477-1187(-)
MSCISFDISLEAFLSWIAIFCATSGFGCACLEGDDAFRASSTSLHAASKRTKNLLRVSKKSAGSLTFSSPNCVHSSLNTCVASLRSFENPSNHSVNLSRKEVSVSSRCISSSIGDGFFVCHSISLFTSSKVFFVSSTFPASCPSGTRAASDTYGSKSNTDISFFALLLTTTAVNVSSVIFLSCALSSASLRRELMRKPTALPLGVPALSALPTSSTICIKARNSSESRTLVAPRLS